MELIITLQGIDKLRRKLMSTQPLYQDALTRALRKSAITVEREAKQNLTVMDAVDTGRLRANVTHRLDPSPTPRFAEVGTNVKHARNVHQGRRPGARMPPPSALLPWVRRNKVAGTFSMRTRRRTGSRVLRQRQDLAAAWAIAKAIARRGIKAKPFLTDALKAATPQIRQWLQQAAREIEREWRR